MHNRLLLLTLSVLFLLAFSARFFAQAIVPDSASLAPVINPPNPQTNIVISLATYLTPGVTVHDAMKFLVPTLGVIQSMVERSFQSKGTVERWQKLHAQR